MYSKFLALCLFFILIMNSHPFAQYSKQDSTLKNYFIGSTFFMLGNLDSKDRPDFAQLNIGYRLTDSDIISLEVKTWKYTQPLGIQYGNSFGSSKEKFPGYIREFGFALAYQKFLWKGMYTGIHIMNAWQSFVDENDLKIDNGYQIFNTYRLGYHFKLFNNKFFIEPSIAITHRPYHTRMPDSFKRKDDQWGKFFFGEPGLHFGYNF